MDQITETPQPASIRDTIGDLALVVFGALAQINGLNLAPAHATPGGALAIFRFAGPL